LSATASKPDAALKRTPLHDAHVRAGARMVPFAGWDMPVQYEGVRQEHVAVRTKAGLFDVSHMGEIRFRGPKAEAALSWLLSNAIRKIEQLMSDDNQLREEIELLKRLLRD
jgi:aminomethyltransferase